MTSCETVTFHSGLCSMELDYYWSSAQSGRMNAMVSTGNDPRILNLTIFSIVSFC